MGQVTLPKEIREELDISKNDFIIIEKIGETYFIKKLNEEKKLLALVREKIKKSGITREKLDEIIEEVSEDIWKEQKGVP